MKERIRKMLKPVGRWRRWVLSAQEASKTDSEKIWESYYLGLLARTTFRDGH